MVLLAAVDTKYYAILQVTQNRAVLGYSRLYTMTFHSLSNPQSVIISLFAHDLRDSDVLVMVYGQAISTPRLHEKSAAKHQNRV